MKDARKSEQKSLNGYTADFPQRVDASLLHYAHAAGISWELDSSASLIHSGAGLGNFSIYSQLHSSSIRIACPS